MANGSVALPRTLGRRLGSLPMVIGGALVFIVAYGLNHGWKATFGPVFDKIGGVSIGLPHLGSVHPLRWLQSANRDLERWFSDAQKYAEKGMVWGFVNFASFWLLIGAALFVIGYEIEQLGEWTGTYVAKAVRGHHLSRVVPRLQALEREAIGRISANVRSLTHRVDTLAERIGHATHVATHAIAAPFPRIGNLEREAGSAAKWLRQHRYLAAFTTLTALGVGILSKLGLGFLRCTNFRKAGKRACGMDASLLESLLADTLLVVGTLSLVEFATEMETVTAEVAPLLRKFWRAV